MFGRPEEKGQSQAKASSWMSDFCRTESEWNDKRTERQSRASREILSEVQREQKRWRWEERCEMKERRRLKE